jgi:hypothetical protein
MSLQRTVEQDTRDLCKGINASEKDYQPRSKLLTDENGDPLADSHNILNSWKNYFSQLFNVHRVSDVRQIEIAAEPLVYDPRRFESEIIVANLKFYIARPCSIPAELIQCIRV